MIKRVMYGVILALAAASCGNAPSEDAAMAYPAMTVGLDSVSVWSLYPAAIKGRTDADIYPQVSGKITAVNVHEGQAVRKGQGLFIIDQVPYQAALRTAEANLAAAKAGVDSKLLSYEGKKQLFEKKVISEYELKMAENDLSSAVAAREQAEAGVVNARNNLSYTVVTSPYDGVVGTIPYRIGSLVGPSSTTPLTAVSDSREMYVYFSIPERTMLTLVREYGSLESAMKNMPPVRLKLSDGSMYEKEGRVESISGIIDATTGSLSVRAAFPNPDGLLHNGGAGDVMLAEHLSGVILIPQGATYELQDKIFVYKVVNGKAEAVRIEATSLDETKQYAVSSGLAAGDVIVTEGAAMIKDGQDIKIRK